MTALLQQSLALTRSSLKARYRNSIAGYLWVFLNPFLMYLAQAYMFQAVFRIRMDDYFQFLLFGLGPWLFFSQTIDMCSGLFHQQARLLKSFPLPPLALILSQALDNFINSLSVIAIALALLTLTGRADAGKVLLFPLPLLVLFIATVGLAALLALINIFFYDVKFITQFAIGLLYFLTPIVYPEHFVPAEFQFLVRLNPLTYFIRPFRSLTAGPEGAFWADLGIAAILASAVCLLSAAVWWRKKNDFYHRI